MKRTLPIVVLLGAALGFGAALWRLLDLRFSAGDVYPPASTFRADPLGARAYHDSLASVPGRKVSRLLEPVHRLGNGADTTLFLPGFNAADTDWLAPPTAGELDDFLTQGGRVVLTLSERGAAEHAFSTNRPGRLRPVPGRTNQWVPAGITVTEHWHFGLGLAPSLSADGTGTNGYLVAATAAAPAEFAREIWWRSELRLAQLGPEWQPLYADTHGPVLAAKPVGQGWLIVATGSSLLCNQALHGERETALLAWLPGPSTRLVFDETHLGTQLKPGVMTLARRYRLHGLGLGLLLVAGLFLWQQATSLVPRAVSPSDHDDALAVHDAATGFVNLLRRALPQSELLGECFRAWRESVGRTRPDLAPRLAAMQDLVNLETARPAKQRNPPEVYRRLTEILNRRDSSRGGSRNLEA